MRNREEISSEDTTSTARTHSPTSQQTVKDPVCRMDMTPLTAVHKHNCDGQSYFFCSRHCMEKFRAEPEKYPASVPPPAVLDAHTRRVSHAPKQGQLHTCPMHPKVRQMGAGACPSCGMALEPRTVTVEEEVNPELSDMTRRFWISLALTLPVFLLAMSEMLPGRPVHHTFSARALLWIQFAFATPVVLWGAGRFSNVEWF